MRLVPRTLRGRLVSGLGLGVIAFIGALAYGEVQLRRVGTDLRVMDAAYLPITQLAARMGAADEPARVVPGLVREAEARVATAESVVGAGEERAALAAIRSKLRDVEAAALEPRDRAARSSRDALRQELGQLGALLQTRITAVSERAATAHDRAETASLAMLGMGIVLGLGLLAALRSALRPVGALTDAASRIAAGEDAPALDATGAEELVTLAAAFDRMALTVRERDRRLIAATAHLRRVLDGIASAVAFARPDAGGHLVVETCNPAARTLWSLEEGGSLPGWLASLASGTHVEISHAGRTLDLSVQEFGADGEHARLIVGDDVTARVEGRDRLARSERLALVGRLLAQVTHEVRNPLNAMSLHAELLAEEPMGGEARAMLATITQEIRRLEGVTARYLDLARRGPGAPTLEDPLALVRGVVQLEDARLRRLGIQVGVTGEAPPCVVEGDTLRRAVLNLVRNAVEAGAREVHIHVLAGDHTLTVRISDDGPGMDPATQARAFEPFFTTRAQGSGLGLAVVRQEVEDAGGSVHVESAPGEGATFTLRLTTGAGV